MRSPKTALASQLQIVQNDFVRQLAGLRRCVPALILSSEACLPLLPAACLRDCSRLWAHSRDASSHDKHPNPLMEAMLRASIRLAASLPDAQAKHTWAGALKVALTATAAGDAGYGAEFAAFWRGAEAAAHSGAALPQLRNCIEAWEAEMERRWAAMAAARGADSAHSQYLTHFALAGDEHVYEPAFPKTMSWPFRHTSRYRCLSHARAMVRLRCCSTPLAACPTNRSATLRVCPRCTLGVDQTAEHMLLDCPSTAPARASAHFAPLFTPPLPPADRMRTLMRTGRHYTLASYVHECIFE